jgi:hypothetical protein
MGSAGGVYDMKKGEYRFMKNRYMFSRLKLCLLVLSGVLLLSSLNIILLLIAVSSVLMKHQSY